MAWAALRFAAFSMLTAAATPNDILAVDLPGAVVPTSSWGPFTGAYTGVTGGTTTYSTSVPSIGPSNYGLLIISTSAPLTRIVDIDKLADVGTTVSATNMNNIRNYYNSGGYVLLVNDGCCFEGEAMNPLLTALGSSMRMLAGTRDAYCQSTSEINSGHCLMTGISSMGYGYFDAITGGTMLFASPNYNSPLDDIAQIDSTTERLVVVGDGIVFETCDLSSIATFGRNFAQCGGCSDANNAPTMSGCQPSTVTLNTNSGVCCATHTFSTPTASDADSCSSLTGPTRSGKASGSCFFDGDSVTYTVRDSASQTASCSWTYDINDNQNPRIDGSRSSTPCPASITRNNNGGQCSAVVSYTSPVGTDNCPGVSTSRIAGLASGSSFPVGSTTQTFRATDSSRRTADCSFSVTVTDAEDPNINCPSNIARNAASGQCSAVVSYSTPSGTDNCPGRTAGLVSGSTFPVGTTTNTFRATDAASRTDTCSFTVTVADAQDPNINCPSNIARNNAAGQCSAAVPYSTPSGTDNCPGVSTARTAGLASGSTFPVGTTTNTSRNNAAGQCSATVGFSTPVGTDNCAGVSTAQTAGQSSGSTFPVGTTTNTFRATDAVGRTDTCSFTVQIVDAEDPNINCPSNIARNNAAGQCSAAVSYTTPVGTDNCAGVSTARTSGLASGSAFPVGTTGQTFRATDAVGRTDTCSFSVTVSDAEAPNIDGSSGSTTCPSNIAWNNDAGQCAAVVSYTTPVGTDNCAGVSTARTAGLASGSSFPVGTTGQTFVATDAVGLADSCSFSVTVTDNENPRLDGSLGSTTCPSNIATNTDPTVCTAAVSYTAPVGADNCPGVSTSRTVGLASGSNFPLGTTGQTFVATDAVGRTDSCSFSVTVSDGEAPRIDGTLGSTPCPTNIATNTDPDVCTAVVTYTHAVGSDNCPGVSTALTTGMGSGSAFPLGFTQQTFTATDAASRTASCSFSVTVSDAEAPRLDGTLGSTPCPGDININNDAGQCSAVVTFTDPVGTDNYPGVATSQNGGDPSGSAFTVGASQQRFRAIDAAGTFSECTFTISVSDVDNPTANHSPAGLVTAFVDDPYGYTVTPADNCAGVTVTRTSGPASTDSSSTPTDPLDVTYQIADANGNSVTYAFQVQTIQAVSGLVSPSYMYMPVEVELAPGLFADSDTHAWIEVRNSGGIQYASERSPLATAMRFEGVSGMVPGVYDYWMVRWPSTRERWLDSMKLCSSEFNCPG